MRQSNAGFTLTELLVVVAIVAVLAAIALPAYQSYSREAKRTDAQNTLLTLANQQEKAYVANNAYTPDMRNLFANCDTEDLKPGVKRCAGDGSSLQTDAVLYTVTVTAANANAFTIQAVANAGTSQALDTPCNGSSAATTMTIDSANRRLPAVCWGR